MSDDKIVIKPIKQAEYILKQPKYKGILYGTPTRCAILGPSGSVSQYVIRHI